jgi:hypothetical protein
MNLQQKDYVFEAPPPYQPPAKTNAPAGAVTNGPAGAMTNSPAK